MKNPVTEILREKPFLKIVKKYCGNTILKYIGNTPLIPLKKIFKKKGISIYAKMEGQNPGGSVKDRPALYMLVEGIHSGKLTRDKTIIEATSGNTGIAIAMIASVLGYRVKLYLPSNASEERKRIMRVYNAEVILTDPLEGTDGAIRAVDEIMKEEPQKFFRPNQYNNPYNPLSHYETTAPEIIRQTRGKITHFVAGIGTSGTLMGTGKRLKEFNPSIKVIAVEPNCPLHGLEGLKHMATSIVPGIYNPDFPDQTIKVDTEEAFEMVKRLAREEGLFVGASSGAAMVATLKVAEEIDSGCIVVIFPDGGDKYLSTRMFSDIF